MFERTKLIDVRAGLKFLRVIHLVRVSDVLQLLKIVKNRTAIHLTWAASVVATVWTCGDCVFYMVGGHGTITSPGSDALSAYIPCKIGTVSTNAKRNKYQLSSTNRRDALHHGKHAANTGGRLV